MMQKLFISLGLLVGVLTFQNTIQAQISIGGGATFATQIEDVGLNVRAQIPVFEVGGNDIAATPNISYYFSGAGLTWLEMNADFSYMLGDPDVIVGYPIIGARYDLTIINIFGFTESVGEFGINAGLGTQYSIGDNLKVYLEGKYLTGVFNRFVIGIGVMTTIGG